MKFLIWFGCIFVATILNTLLGYATGVKVGYLIFYFVVYFVAKKLCDKWDERKMVQKTYNPDDPNCFTECKSCGYRDKKNFTTCPNCGERATKYIRLNPEEELDEGKTDIKEDPVAEADKIRFCRKCGEKLIENSRFCRKCGTEIVD